MRVRSVSLLSDQQETIDLNVDDPLVKSTYILKKMDGDDADELMPKFYGYNFAGNKKFYDLKPKPRTLTFLIQLNPSFAENETYEDLRDQLYRQITATRAGLIELQFRSGSSAMSKLYGFITKFEAPKFTKVPTVKLTVRCTDPMFKAPNPTLLTGLSGGTHIIGDPFSTAPHGMVIDVTFTGTQATFVVQDKATGPDWQFDLTPNTSFLSGDILRISSEFGNRYAYRVRGGVTTHLMNFVKPESIWPSLFPGQNNFYFPQSASFTWNSISFYPSFWGL